MSRSGRKKFVSQPWVRCQGNDSKLRRITPRGSISCTPVSPIRHCLSPDATMPLRFHRTSFLFRVFRSGCTSILVDRRTSGRGKFSPVEFTTNHHRRSTLDPQSKGEETLGSARTTHVGQPYLDAWRGDTLIHARVGQSYHRCTMGRSKITPSGSSKPGR